MFKRYYKINFLLMYTAYLFGMEQQQLFILEKDVEQEDVKTIATEQINALSLVQEKLRE